MLRKLGIMTGTIALLGSVVYTAMAFNMVMRSDSGIVLTIAASERLPYVPRAVAAWQVKNWNECPTVERDVGALGQTLRSHGIDGYDDGRVLQMAAHLIAVGCDVNERSLTGNTPLHEAILYNEPEVVRFLLAHGANPLTTIELPAALASKSRSNYSGMNAIRFTETLQSKTRHTVDRQEILAMLRNHQKAEI